MKTKFTTLEIKEWLEGWFIAGKYEDGRRKGLSLESILVLLECDQDGIEAYFERKELQRLAHHEYKDWMNKGHAYEKD